jgi:hypothetical protein
LLEKEDTINRVNWNLRSQRKENMSTSLPASRAGERVLRLRSAMRILGQAREKQEAGEKQKAREKQAARRGHSAGMKEKFTSSGLTNSSETARLQRSYSAMGIRSLCTSRCRGCTTAAAPSTRDTCEWLRHPTGKPEEDQAPEHETALIDWYLPMA